MAEFDPGDGEQVEDSKRDGKGEGEDDEEKVASAKGHGADGTLYGGDGRKVKREDGKGAHDLVCGTGP